MRFIMANLDNNGEIGFDFNRVIYFLKHDKDHTAIYFEDMDEPLIVFETFENVVKATESLR